MIANNNEGEHMALLIELDGSQVTGGHSRVQ